MPQGKGPLRALYFAGSFIGILFGAIHLAAWNIEFPSVADRWLWRSASIAITLLPAIFGLLTRTILSDYINSTSSDSSWSRHPVAFLLLLYLCGGTLLYIAGRGILLVEMIRTLFYLPPRAYLTSNWTMAIPHIS